MSGRYTESDRCIAIQSAVRDRNAPLVRLLGEQVGSNRDSLLLASSSRPHLVLNASPPPPHRLLPACYEPQSRLSDRLPAD